MLTFQEDYHSVKVEYTGCAFFWKNGDEPPFLVPTKQPVAFPFCAAQSAEVPAELESDRTASRNSIGNHRGKFHLGNNGGFKTMWGEECTAYKKPGASSSVGLQGCTKGYVCCCSLLSSTTDIFKGDMLRLGTPL